MVIANRFVISCSDLGERSPPDGAGEETVEDISTMPEKPERIYKVVFIGDSCVGKTSILRRFCHDEFKEDGLASTIGVDFQIRSMRVDGYFVALQLWDTAGQERFRSITSQYYRKADGVVLVYDITSESTFLSLRQWMLNVKDAVEDGTAIMVLANKSDMREQTEKQTAQASGKLSDLIDAEDVIFFNCSAKSGDNISPAFQALGKALTKKENNDLRTAITVESTPKKGCCNR